MLISILPAQNFKGRQQQIEILPPYKKLTIGETLTYSAEWLGIPIGRIILKVVEIKNINGYACYHVNAQALPNRFFRRFYDIEYKVDTYIDTKTFYTQRFEKTRRIKDIFTYVIIEFNREKNEATYRYYSPGGSVEIIDFPSLRKEIVANEIITIKVPAYAQDLLSSLYYFRLQNIKEGRGYSLNISYHSKNWPVDIKIEKPFLKDLHKKGTFAVIELSPSSALNNFILGRRGMRVYFTVDSRRMPLLFTLNTAIGIIRGVICDLPK